MMTVDLKGDHIYTCTFQKGDHMCTNILYAENRTVQSHMLHIKKNCTCSRKEGREGGRNGGMAGEREEGREGGEEVGRA